MPVVNSILSALLQVALLGGIPFLAYAAYQRWRHKRPFRDSCRRAGLQVGEPRYLLYAAVLAVVVVVVLVVWTPPLEPLTREGSAQAKYAGMGISLVSITMAVLYGAVQTGFTEELLFRGLIAGSLFRRLAFAWANLLQTLIFLLPHGLLLLVAPELWPMLPVVFAGALVFGWLRAKSGSILGPWILHGAGNVAIALIVAARTVA